MPEPNATPAPLTQEERDELEVRIMSKCVVSDGCWHWTAGRNGHGYATVSVRHNSTPVSRVIYAIKNGPIPAGMCVCHRCDNRLCVNPAHLFLGTNADNTADRNAKGRQATGPRNPKAKVDVVSAREIIRRMRAGEFASSVGAAFGISGASVKKIASGGTWAARQAMATEGVQS